MNEVCLIWSRDRLISPSLPVGDDRYLNLSSQKRPSGRNLGESDKFQRVAKRPIVPGIIDLPKFNCEDLEVNAAGGQGSLGVYW